MLDIDRADLPDALADARRLVQKIHQRYPEFDGNVPVYFSGGKGFHLLVELVNNPPPAVGFQHVARTFAEHGCNCSISSNNILNPFTPFGDGSLIRMANLHANILQVGQPERLAELFAMITERSARLMNLTDYAIEVGHPADIVILDATSRAEAVATVAPVVACFKRGRQTVDRPRTRLIRPD